MKRQLCPLLTLAIVVLTLLPGTTSAQSRWTQLNSQFAREQEAGRYQQSQKTAEAMLQLARSANNTQAVAAAAGMLAESYQAQERYAEAAQFYQFSLRLLPKDENVLPLINFTHQRLCLSLADASKYDEAVTAYRAFIEHLEKTAGPESESLVAPLAELANIRIKQHKFDEVETLLTRADQIARLQPTPSRYLLAGLSREYGRLRRAQFRLQEAFELHTQALAGYEAEGDPAQVANTLTDTALVATQQYRFREAEALLTRARGILTTIHPPEHLSLSQNDYLLGEVYRRQGRFAEAESLLAKAYAVRLRKLGENHSRVAESLHELASLYRNQNRPDEATPFIQKAIATKEQVWGKEHAQLVPDLALYANLLTQAKRFDEAVQVEQRALKIIGFDSLLSGTRYASLGDIHFLQGNLDQAEAAYRKAQEINDRLEREKGFHFYQHHTSPLLGLARVHQARGEFDQALPLFDEAIHRLEVGGSEPSQLARGYGLRGICQFEAGKRDKSEADLQQAMTLVEAARTNFSGSELDRAKAFATPVGIIESMVALQALNNNPAKALAAMERGRNQSLLDQLAAQGVDLMAGIPSDLQREFEQRLAKAGSQIAEAEASLTKLLDDDDTNTGLRKSHIAELETTLVAARNDYLRVQADIRNASPAYRLAVSRDREPVSLDTLQDYVDQHNAVLLRYFVGPAAFVVVLTPQQPAQVVRLSADEAAAKALEIEPGNLSADSLGLVMRRDDGTGVLQLLRKSAQPAVERVVAAKLAALWNVLIPAGVGNSLQDGSYDRLIIVPDHELSKLPFEALAVGSGDDPQYLVDVGPPIEYAPSATVFDNLVRRAAEAETANEGVLTVGDPTYANAAGVASSRSGTRYRAVGGVLSQLPYSGIEASWVESVFSRAGDRVEKLVGAAATEATVRAKVANRRVIHFACHGLVDQSHGNLFGALALAPDRSSTASENDGFLTLDEIYRLNLSGCELTILSACDTNVGPTQAGEGVWALSRGFLVAGSRRVVASNWVVDDKAAASLISYLCSYIAQSRGQGQTVDYARCLHNAQRGIRNQDQWRSPYYWAAFVQIGPQ